jgi:predicted nucleotidyltransferase
MTVKELMEQNENPRLLRELFAGEPALELAVLIGSRVPGRVRFDSDWDIAIQWQAGFGLLDLLGRTESLRRKIGSHLGVPDTRIDLIDIPAARLAMRSVIAEEGLVLKGEENPAWSRFLLRTWRELEEYYWETIYAA